MGQRPNIEHRGDNLYFVAVFNKNFNLDFLKTSFTKFVACSFKLTVQKNYSS